MEPMRSLHVADEGDSHSELDDIPYSELQSGCAGPPPWREILQATQAGLSMRLGDVVLAGGGLVNRGHKLSDHARSFAGRLKVRI